jgi:hypothetical protein
MHSLESVLFIAAIFASAAFSSPMPTKTIQKRSFVHHVKRSINKSHPMSGSNAMYRAYRKYGFPLGDRKFANTTVSRAAGGMNGQVSADPSNGAAEYVSQVTIGGQTMVLDFDTGSSDL